MLFVVAVIVAIALLSTFSRAAVAMAALGLIVLAFTHGPRAGFLVLFAFVAPAPPSPVFGRPRRCRHVAGPVPRHQRPGSRRRPPRAPGLRRRRHLRRR